MIFRHATTADRPTLIELLHEVGLLTDDLPTDLAAFTLAFDDEKLAGAAGVEMVGSSGLLRSVAVSPAYRQHQLGRRLIDACLKLAAANGIDTLYLITTTADGYFEQLGFSRVDRVEVPDSIAQTRQFSDLCPASSVVMLKKM